MQRSTSADLFARARELMPGGVSSPVRAFRSVGGHPIYYRRAEAASFEDVDGNHYVDFCMSWGPLILGHAFPAVVEAVRDAAGRGLSYGACCPAEIELAERILGAFPDKQRVRFVSSGTEAVMTAIRLARGVTGRPAILKFAGGYHGHSDSLLVKAGSGLATFGTSSSLGVPQEIAGQTVVCPFDDLEQLEQVFALHGARLAAAIVEPLPANNGLLEQTPAWLQRLRKLCSQSGALLIFDEVISGFRTRFGGYGDGLGIPCDLVTLGKVIGGGMPVGALAGSAALMEQLAPEGGVYQAGTLSGNPVSLAAGIATLDQLADGAAYAGLEELGAHFDAQLHAVAGSLQWRRCGSIIWLYLDDGPIPRRADAISSAAIDRFAPLHRSLLDQGIYLPPSGYEVFFLSTAHSPAQVESLALAVAGASGG